MAPRVSVVIPAYEAASSIESTLASVAAQTFSDLEVLVVDDGSSDATADLAARHPVGAVVIRQANAGVSAARNAAIDRASGDLVAFLDADDTWEPRKLELQVALADADPTIGVVYSSTTVVDDEDRPTRVIEVTSHDDPIESMLLRSSIMALSSGMVRRELLDDVRFDPRFSQCADWHLWLRLGLRTRFAPVPTPLLRYRMGATNMSTNVALLERDTFAVLDAFYAEEPGASRYLPIRDEVYSNHWMIVGGSYLHARQVGDALRCIVRGVRLHPSNVARPLGLPVRWARRVGKRPR
jgi:glycosyltransferase involved in cell wall biosynthesis